MKPTVSYLIHKYVGPLSDQHDLITSYQDFIFLSIYILASASNCMFLFSLGLWIEYELHVFILSYHIGHKSLHHKWFKTCRKHMQKIDFSGYYFMSGFTGLQMSFHVDWLLCFQCLKEVVIIFACFAGWAEGSGLDWCFPDCSDVYWSAGRHHCGRSSGWWSVWCLGESQGWWTHLWDWVCSL